ncbi:hypothetical protein EWM62_07280 [Mucilaginibacter terrigena]|uniref:Carboxypeptidase-like regulatory domain-containing protein n=1 Tax=Mucilaginibacter terrigena TaxID=2492395 RepID=A0A4Q5LMV8_9SPHI|nr:hypothetical protein [Mucilaginibacter terrigena]RYU90452.1 hypothetical protein EWM62_07280 [Mucilaginibacter terrigena]
MHRYLLIIALFIHSAAYTQGVFKGRVFENKTRISLAGIRVDNLNNKKTTVTNNNGDFNIAAKNGDLLVFKGFAYQPDTLLITDLHDKEIFLEPVTHELDQVNISVTETKSLNTYFDPQFHGQPVVYARDKDMNYKGGIVLRLWYWKKDEKKRARLQALERKYAVMDKITAVFQPKVIAQYLPLTGIDLDNFINLYTPTPKIVSAKDFSLPNYLNTCFKKYQALPPDKRQPPTLTGQ